MSTTYEMYCKSCGGKTPEDSSHHWLVGLTQSESFGELVQCAIAFNLERHEYSVLIEAIATGFDLVYCGFDPECDHDLAIVDGYGRDLPADRYPIGTKQSGSTYCGVGEFIRSPPALQGCHNSRDSR